MCRLIRVYPYLHRIQKSLDLCFEKSDFHIRLCDGVKLSEAALFEDAISIFNCMAHQNEYATLKNYVASTLIQRHGV